MSASPSTPLRRRVPSKKATIATPDKSPLRNSTRANQLINDDAAERAARRKSAHFADIGLGTGKEKEHHVASPAGRKASALAVQKERRAKRLSAVTPAPQVSMEVMNTNFEEWMKLATDNKITATNTWNFALIDYFHDLTLLRNGPNDQSINFQKASCTLDGCVKIWTSRVDSVATETGKLLSGLAGGAGDANDDEDGDEDDNGEPKQTRKTHRSEATLAKSHDALRVKKFDLEFTVDPLFKKTSADFDEGGATGLLMNHLGIDGTGRVVFDAGDAIVEEYEEDDEEELEDVQVDISRLRSLVPSAEETAGLTISDTLSGFYFGTDADLPDLATITGLSSFNDEPELDDAPMATGEAHDFFGDEDFDMGGPSGGADDSMSMMGDDELDGGMTASGGEATGFGPFDPRRGAGMALAFNGADDPDSMFQYFDAGFGKSWAGAEHWKLKRISRKDPAVAAATREKKAPKVAFTIDFTGECPSTKALFAPGTKAATQLPQQKRSHSKSAAATRRDEWLLPNDMHFSSRQLLRLFLKPKFALRSRRTSNEVENANGEIDETFWAQAAADRAAGGEVEDDGAPMPFESQFFHDDVDADGDDDAFVDDVLEVDDLWATTQGEELRRARPENVRYAKKAKRVDVKRLKDDIWSDLRSLVERDSDSDEADKENAPNADKADKVPQEKEESKTFTSVIHSLRDTYPKEKMAEISTSFCFICLLHLANEEGLRIETARTDGTDGFDSGMRGLYNPSEDEEAQPPPAKRLDMGERHDRIVGELQALRVFKDPNAGRAA